jgi:hypothetical protein
MNQQTLYRVLVLIPVTSISDSVFYDFGTMSVEDIQRFLDSKVTNCTAKAGPTCLRYYTPDIPDVPADPGKRAGAHHRSGRANRSATDSTAIAGACGIKARRVLFGHVAKRGGV